MLRGYRGSRADSTVLGHCRFLVPIFSDRWNFVVAIFYCYLKFEMIFIDNTDTSGATEWAFHGREGEKERVQVGTEDWDWDWVHKNAVMAKRRGSNCPTLNQKQRPKASSQHTHTHTYEGKILSWGNWELCYTLTHIFACQYVGPFEYCSNELWSVCLDIFEHRRRLHKTINSKIYKGD